jgi:flagellar basal-body rod protein FlgC
MSLGSILSATDISASGLAAERLRMEVVANNIANAYSTRSPEGGPYRRQQVLFEAAYDDALRGAGKATGELQGVKVLAVEPDMSELPKIFQPGHPDADDSGFVDMPNVQPAMEMVDLITASRAYEANLRVLRNFREMVEQALSLLRGGQ